MIIQTASIISHGKGHGPSFGQRTPAPNDASCNNEDDVDDDRKQKSSLAPLAP